MISSIRKFVACLEKCGYFARGNWEFSCRNQRKCFWSCGAISTMGFHFIHSRISFGDRFPDVQKAKCYFAEHQQGCGKLKGFPFTQHPLRHGVNVNFIGSFCISIDTMMRIEYHVCLVKDHKLVLEVIKWRK